MVYIWRKRKDSSTPTTVPTLTLEKLRKEGLEKGAAKGGSMKSSIVPVLGLAHICTRSKAQSILSFKVDVETVTNTLLKLRNSHYKSLLPGKEYRFRNTG